MTVDLEALKLKLTGIIDQDPPIPVPWGGLEDGQYRPEARTTGTDWPQHAPCMIGLCRLDNVQACVEQALAEGVPGDLAECGVWRGGTCIFMRALLKLHGVTDRDVWAIDSFQGLPPHEAWQCFNEPEQASLAVPLSEVRRNFELYGMLDDQVKFLKGWFCDTLPTAPIGSLAVLRLDGDLYESQLDALTHLYPRLSPGGYVIIDDPHLPACAKAVAVYREKNSIDESVTWTEDGYALWWRKP